MKDEEKIVEITTIEERRIHMTERVKYKEDQNEETNQWFLLIQREEKKLHEG